MLDDFYFSKTEIVIFCVLFLVAVMIITFFVIKALGKKEKQLKRYVEINRGMSEQQALSILGGGYSRSLLNDNRTKYQWNINGKTDGFIYKGVVTAEHTAGKYVIIYIKDGVVDEVLANNI